MKIRRSFFVVIAILLLVTLACQTISDMPTPSEAAPTEAPTPKPTFTPLSFQPTAAEERSVDEPVFISGEIPYTSPFFLNTISAPFVMLEDQAGFVKRDREHPFDLEDQVIGPVEVHDDGRLTYSLSLPTVPQGDMLDVDNDGEEDSGVQIFAVAYWSNTWGGPFLEERDGTGWSTAYASTITDSENDDEIKSGTLVIWAPNGEQAFPTGFGDDGLLFTEDDPTELIPAGYSIVELDQSPFRIYKESRVEITLNEGEVAVNDYSDMSFSDAFDAMFEKASREYPFTEEKNIDWQAIYDEFAPRVAGARSNTAFYEAIRDFTYAFPDGHVGVPLDPQVFFEERGGSFGLVLTELSDGRVLVSQVLPETPGARGGIQVGAQILEWGGQDIRAAIEDVIPAFGPYSTDHARRVAQVTFVTRVPVDTSIEVTYRNPGQTRDQTVKMTAEIEYGSLFAAMPVFSRDELHLPIEGEVLDEYGLGYVRINTFSADYNLMAKLWDHFIDSLLVTEVPGLIIDVRTNSGGSSGMANDFAAYFFDEQFDLYQRSYFNDETGSFEYTDYPTKIKPAPKYYEGAVAVLVGPDCISACEGFAYAMKQGGRAIIVGSYATAGAFGEVGRGQYKLPADLSVQFPTGRPETMDGELLIEGVGVLPDIDVPITEESVLTPFDAVLDAAAQAVIDQLQ